MQSQLPESRVVKGFNNINYLHLGSLQRPAGSPDRSVLAVAGDDADAKAAVSEFLDSIGYDAYDAGPLAESWRFDVGTPAYGRPYNTDTTGAFPPPADSGRQVTAEAMRGGAGRGDALTVCPGPDDVSRPRPSPRRGSRAAAPRAAPWPAVRRSAGRRGRAG